jgi:hypothetical protein
MYVIIEKYNEIYTHNLQFVGMNPFISKTLNGYRQSFQDLATSPPVTDMQSNQEFTRRLEDLVRSHANDIPVLAKGYVAYRRSPLDPRISQTFI